MARHKDTLTLSVPPGTKEKLEAIAASLDLMWGQSGSPSALIAAIAQGSVQVRTAPAFNPAQLSILASGLEALIEASKLEEAQALAAFLKAMPGLPLEVQKRIGAAFRHAGGSMREALQERIERRQPFLLFYQDSKGEDRSYTVRHARLRFFRGMTYLDIWSDETDGSDDAFGFNHNWGLRVDRIQHLEDLPGAADWRADRDHVEVRLRLRNRLAHDYRGHEDDVADVRTEGGEREVTRRVYASFWFLRDVLPFGADCEVLSPLVARGLIAAEMAKVLERYRD